MTAMAGDNNKRSKRNSMAPAGTLAGAGASQSMGFGKRERLYRVWPGNNVGPLSTPVLLILVILSNHDFAMWAYGFGSFPICDEPFCVCLSKFVLLVPCL